MIEYVFACTRCSEVYEKDTQDSKCCLCRSETIRKVKMDNKNTIKSFKEELKNSPFETVLIYVNDHAIRVKRGAILFEKVLCLVNINPDISNNCKIVLHQKDGYWGTLRKGSRTIIKDGTEFFIYNI